MADFILSILKFVMAFSLNYYIESRFLYSFQFDGTSDKHSTIDVERIIRNRFSKIIFPKVFKTPNESTYGICKISVVSLIHCIFLYFPVQISYIVSVAYVFYDLELANDIMTVVFKVMMASFTILLTANMLEFLIAIIVKAIKEKRKG